jgi:serine/threonine protein kinase
MPDWPPPIPTQFRLHLPLSDAFRFAHEPIEAVANDRFIGRRRHLDSLADRLLFSNGGAFLITGYRGVGKTSFVNQLINRLECSARERNRTALSRVVGIHLNLARPLTPVDLMFLVIRCLYLQLRDLGIDRELDPAVARELSLVYGRTMMTIKETRSAANELSFTSPSMETDAGGAKAKIGSFFGYKVTKSQGSETAYLPYEERAAEYDLIQLSRRLVRAWHGPVRWWMRLLPWIKPPLGELKIVFVFDELDKIENAQTLDDLFAMLKNLFTTSGLTFLFVAGKDVQERWGREIGRGESIYESVFAYETYLPCLWDQVPALCARSLDQSGPQLPEIDVLWRSLAFQGRGIPRRILRTFHNYVQWQDGRPHLALTPYEFRDAEYYAGLESVLTAFRERVGAARNRIEDSLPASDKRALGFYYLLDWILQRGTAEFTLADAIKAYEELNVKLVSTGGTNEIRALLVQLRHRGYIEIASTVAHKQFVRPNEQTAERYRLTRSALPETSDSTADSATAVRFGSYLLLEQLGAGGMGTVARALNTETNEIVAIKYVREASPAVRQLFHTEAQVLSYVSHPDIPRFFSFDDTGDAQVLAMEFIEGASLQRILTRTSITEEQAAVEVALGLTNICSYLHKQDYVHGDLKPSNILLQASGRVILTDFSTARKLEASVSEFGIAGTPAYMAPELLAGGASSARSDIYALGVVLYEMMCGRLPFLAKNHEDLVDQVLNGSVRTPSKIARVSPGLEDLILSCMARDSSRRPASMDEVRDVLSSFTHSSASLIQAVTQMLGSERSPAAADSPDLITSEGWAPPVPRPSTPAPPAPPPPTAPAANFPQAVEARTTCPACGSAVESDSNFCLVCGTPLGAASPPADPNPTWTSLGSGGMQTPTAATPASKAPAAKAQLELESVDRSYSGRNVYPMWGDQLRIGRSAEADVSVGDTSLSRLHAVITFERGRFFLMDLGSLNGTRLNSLRLPAREPTELHDGDRITLGSWSVKFRSSGPIN